MATTKRGPGRPRKVKKEEPAASKEPTNGLLASSLPTWAYKPGHKPVILRTEDEVKEYVKNGWCDKRVE